MLEGDYLFPRCTISSIHVHCHYGLAFIYESFPSLPLITRCSTAATAASFWCTLSITWSGWKTWFHYPLKGSRFYGMKRTLTSHYLSVPLTHVSHFCCLFYSLIYVPDNVKIRNKIPHSTLRHDKLYIICPYSPYPPYQHCHVQMYIGIPPVQLAL